MENEEQELDFDKGNIIILAKTKTGGYLPYMAIKPDLEKAGEVYELPLRLKLRYAGQESQSKTQTSG